jgi:hypothetical protein
MSIATKIIQYNTNGATFSVQKQLVITTVSTGYVNIEAGGGGVTDHGALTGLGDDDHTQYLTEARGDARYYTQAETDTLLGDKQPLSAVLTATTASFTTADETKLDGIAAGAEVNVNSDWGAVSGDAQILNKPSTFPPSSHTHVIADVTGLQTALDGKEGTITAGTTAQYWRGDKSWQTMNKSSVGLGNVDNTSDADKPVSTATATELGNKQPLDGDLTAIAALSGTGYAKKTGVNTWALDAPLTYATATIDFGSTPVNESVITVTDAAISSTDYVDAFIMIDFTVDNNVDDHRHAAASWKLSCLPSNGSFDLYVDCLVDLCYGTFKIRYTFG